ncbi:hypothetical protein KOR42_53690 [Thalassoglobus neptunius]|uniref:Uncharacterized protein n=1 Tax=Thalassoglobus neptunius TaxID=1938619 RepID=A0A5C5V688_9PLAN|nr:hypothetical protein KOR42_53690 [Thalassoglobus neptunius]
MSEMDGLQQDMERVRSALAGDNVYQKRIAECGIEWLATILKKNNDYNSLACNPLLDISVRSFTMSPVLRVSRCWFRIVLFRFRRSAGVTRTDCTLGPD